MKTISSFIISSIASISTIIGFLIILISKKKNEKIIISSLSISSAVMLTISALDLIPNTIYYLNGSPLIIIFIISGITLGYLTDKTFNKKNKNHLYKIGLISMLAIIIHNIPEGIITFVTCQNNIKIGITTSLAIALHNIPEGISISIPIYYGTGSKKKALIATTISGLSEILGSIIGFVFLSKYMTNKLFGILFSITAGIMIYISIIELLKTSLSYNNKKLTSISFIIGIIISLIPLIILQ